VLEACPAVPWIPLLDRVTPEDCLPTDPHPNANVDRVLAHWIAQDLFASLKWIPGTPPPVEIPREYLSRRATPKSLPGVADAGTRERNDALAKMSDVIEPATGHGVQQVYAGLSPTGIMGPRLLAGMKKRSGSLEVELAPLSGRSDLVPMDVAVRIGG